MDYSSWTKQLRCFLVEAHYLFNGEVQVLRKATHPYRTHANDSPSYTPYGDSIVAMGEFERDMPEAFNGKSRYQQGEITLFLDDELMAIYRVANFSGQRVRILVGDPAAPLSQFHLLLSHGLGDALTVSGDQATLSFSDRAAILDTPLLTATVAATGELKPKRFGRCYNVEPVLLDAQQGQFVAHDGACQAITVKEAGMVISAKVDTATGTFTLQNAVSGVLTCDVDGAVVDGVWLQSAEQIINHLLVDVLGLHPIANPGTLPDYLLGLDVSSDESIAQLLDKLVINAGYYYNRHDQFTLYRLANPSQAVQMLTPDDIKADSFSQVERLLPVTSVSIGYQRNWTPLNTVAGLIAETQPAQAARLKREYNYAQADNADVTQQFPQATPITRDTLIVKAEDAQTEAQYLADFYAVPRFVFSLERLGASFAWELGQVVSLDYPALFDATKLVTVTRLTDVMDDDGAALEVLL